MNKSAASRLSIAWAPFYASLAVISALGMFIGVFWAINEYQAYLESVENIRENYRAQYESRVREEVEAALDYITNSREQDRNLAEEDIRERVQSAYTVAAHIYRSYQQEKTVPEMREMVSEILRPIRWQSGQGYYFAGTLQPLMFSLFADEPYFEELPAGSLKDVAGVDLLGKISDVMDREGAGAFRDLLQRPSYPGQERAQLSFVKYFEPFKWFIGAAVYRDDLSHASEEQLLAQLEKMSFGDGGEVFVFRRDGTIISSRHHALLGRSVLQLRDGQEFAYGRALLDRSAAGGAKGGFVSFVGERGGQPQQMLSFVKSYPQLGWVVGASLYMQEMERAIAAETATYQQISFRNVFMFIALFIVAVGLLLFSTYIYSLKLQGGFQSFVDFFRNAAKSNEKMRGERLEFVEFADLAELANEMVEERVVHEKLLHRDELRLDTLLQLGLMDELSLQDKYEFVLQRTVEITGSEAGYIALVNSNQNYVSLCCSVEQHGAHFHNYENYRPTASRSMAGVVSSAIRAKQAAIVNDNRLDSGDLFPYEFQPTRHLDVPIFNEGKVVMVAGVCNSESPYGTSDIRQLSMLMEGMWLHVLKRCAEEERSRLEQQIITVAEEERSAIGRDLHDDLCSHLSGVELLSKVLHQKLEREGSAGEAQLGVIRRLIREAIDKTRRLSHGLYPVHIIEYGLQAALEELVVEVESMFRLNCLLDFQDTTEQLEDDILFHLHYIVREAVFNAARHGKAANIYIDVRLAGPLFIQIRDDGVGFARENNKKGLGFYTMEYRARMLGAQFSVASQPNLGTTVTISG